MWPEPEVRRTPARRRVLAWMAGLPLIVLALAAAGGRAIALATGGEPFEWLYPLLPTVAVEDARTLDSWFRLHAGLTWTHIVAGSLVLLLAPLQFSPEIRRRHLGLHRWSGRATLLAALPAGLSGLALQARAPFGGLCALSAIVAAGTLFLGAGGQAYVAIRRGQQQLHREWMIRLLAVGLGVGAVRVVTMPLVLLTGERPLELAGVAFWVGFGIPVVAAEWWIRMGGGR